MTPKWLAINLASKWQGKGDALQDGILGLCKNVLFCMRQTALCFEWVRGGRGHPLEMTLSISMTELTSVFCALFCPFRKLKQESADSDIIPLWPETRTTSPLFSIRAGTTGGRLCRFPGDTATSVPGWNLLIPKGLLPFKFSYHSDYF